MARAFVVVLLLAAAVLAIVLPGWMSRDNRKRFREDGARNSLRSVFHRQHALWRILANVVGGTVPWGMAMWLCHLPLKFAFFGALGYCTAAAGWFLFWFQQKINLNRQPPKDRWYVSQQENTPGVKGSSALDRWLNRQAADSGMSPEWENRWFCIETLIACIAAGVPCYLIALSFLFR